MRQSEKFLTAKIACAIVAHFLFCSVAAGANAADLISEKVDQIFDRLERGENPEGIFEISFSGLAPGEGRVAWIEPKLWIPSAKEKDLAGYVGSLAYGRFDAPFHRAFLAMTSYADAPRYIPGILSTKVLERKRLGKEEEVVIVERARELPAALRAFSGYDSRYRLRYDIRFKEGAWVLIRIRLHAGGKRRWEGRPLTKEIEAVEFMKCLEGDRLAYLSFGFALPNVGFLPIQKTSGQKVPGLLNSVTLGVADKIASRLDIGGQLFLAIADSILDGTYQTMFSLMQVTTDSRWNSKWVHQLNLQETREVFRENEAGLEAARKKGWIAYPPR